MLKIRHWGGCNVSAYPLPCSRLSVVHIFREVSFLILDFMALYLFPVALLQICVKVDWSLE